MNTLETFGIFMFVFLGLCVQCTWKWVQHVQPWTVLDTLWAIYFGLGLIISSGAFVYLLMHPAAIQPVLSWLSWLLSFFLVFNAASLGVELGRRIRQPRSQS